jgi:hypothetical protein
MKLPKHVNLVEVGPRDGLQNEKQEIPACVAEMGATNGDER